MLTKTNVFGVIIRKVYIVRNDTSEKIVFQFNPSEWSEEHSAIYNNVDSPGSYYPEINYSGQAKREIAIQAFVDGLGYNISVEDKIQAFIDLTKPSDKNIKKYGGKTFAEPPYCSFVWGDKVKKVVIQTVKVIRKQFDRNLNTTVAELNISMLEYSE